VLHVTGMGGITAVFCSCAHFTSYLIHTFLYLIIVHIRCQFYRSASISWFTRSCFSSLLLLLPYIYICVCWLLYCLVSWYRSCRVSFGWGPPPYSNRLKVYKYMITDVQELNWIKCINVYMYECVKVDVQKPEIYIPFAVTCNTS
jgi:hypothetical protein